MLACIVGKKWKTERDEVKEHYKKLAHEFKARHMQTHPGYQYAPRKSHEKKRRMTARKAAEISKAGDIYSGENSSEDHTLEFSTAAFGAEAILDIARPDPSQLFSTNNEGNTLFTLPTNNSHTLQIWVNEHNTNIEPGTALPFNPGNHGDISTSIAPHVQNDQDFADSLIDWEGIDADYKIVQESTAEEMMQLKNVELGSDDLSLVEEAQRALFKAELERTMKFF